MGIGTTDLSLFNSVGGAVALAVVGDSASTAILGNTGAAMAIVNKDGTASNTAGLHFARADTDETPNYAGASIVTQFGETQATGQYPSASMSFLTSSAANSAPSFKMILTAAGRLGIGVTAPASLLHVAGTVQVGLDDTGHDVKFFGATSGSYMLWDESTDDLILGGAARMGIGTTAPVNLLQISNSANQTDTYGNVQINYTGTVGASNSGLTVKSYSGTSQFMQWATYGVRIGSRIITNSGVGDVIFTAGADSEKMRIRATGNVGIGTTAPVARMHIETNVDRQCIRVRDTDAPSGEFWHFGPDGSNSIVVENQSNVGVYIADGGNSWGSLSDERLKTNVQPLNVTSGLEAIMRLDAVTFDWRFGQRPDTNIGLIAQNVRDVFPSLVSTTSTRTFHLDDGTEEEITDPLGVEYTGLIVPLIKATQELKATIDAQATLIASLETRITTLEG